MCRALISKVSIRLRWLFLARAMFGHKFDRDVRLRLANLEAPVSIGMEMRCSPENNSIELFTGAGGLALGVARAGFRHTAVIEWNSNACDSLRRNAVNVSEMAGWPVFEGDIREFDFAPHRGAARLLAAGAPCQPFSLGGKHQGDTDGRNMFPQVFRAVRDVAPEIVIVENVKGLLRQSFRPYFDYIKRQIAAPELSCPRDSDWREHDARLARKICAGKAGELTYEVEHQLLNSADFGVPQSRERVFIVAIRSDIGVHWTDMASTHSADALLYAKWVDGSYWREHKLPPPSRPKHLGSKIERIEGRGASLFETRWQTVRDALKGLPEPMDQREHRRIRNHVGNPGARSYPGHTGSPYDEPAKTMKAGDHGVPGGENTLRREDGSVRYFTVREAARLQCFPDEYEFAGAWSEGFRQLGNAVPVLLAESVVRHAVAIVDRVRQHQPAKVSERVA